MLKKVLAVILSVLMIVTFIPFVAMANTAEPVELEGNGWIGISTAEDFLKIGKDDNFPFVGNYYLQNDIDFGGAEYQFMIENFTGNLDGRGFALYNFKLVANDGDCGVFKQLTTDAATNSKNTPTAVYDLKIGKPDAPVTATVTSTSNDLNVGFLAAYRAKGTSATLVNNVDVYGSITLNASSTKTLRAAGLIGYARDLAVTDCSFTGAITVKGTAASKHFVGGLIGEADGYGANRSMVIKDSAVDATISATTDVAEGLSHVGGVIGFSSMPTTFVRDCTVKGSVTSGDNVGGIVGSIDCKVDAQGTTTTLLLAVTGNKLSATLDGETKGSIYGYQNTEGKAERIYIYNNEGAADANTEARDFGDFSGDFDATKNYVWLIDEAADFAKIGTTDTTNNYTYSATGLYRLENDIDMGGAARTASVVNLVFGGVMDGDNYAIKNLAFSLTAQGGLFKDLANTSDDVLLMNLSVGTKDSPVAYSSSAQFAGVITPGSNADGKLTTMDNVDVYANMTCTSMNGNTMHGGFMGWAARVGFYDCNFYGSISSNTATTQRNHFAGFVPLWGGRSSIVYGCNNYADMNIALAAPSATNHRVYVGGITAGTSTSVIISETNNFGNITNLSTNFNGDGGTSTAGIQAGLWAYSGNGASLIQCSNFGDITSTNFANGASKNNSGVVVIADFQNYGKITGANSNYLYSDGGASVLNCSDNTLIDMVDGASVRLSGETGIRFMANVSASGIDRLKDIYGDSAVSYGVIIAPDQFITQAGAFTHAALDAYSTPVNGFTDGSKAYVDIVAEGFFNNEEGKVAGSLIEIPASLYNVDLCGVAYIMIKDAEGKVVRTIYASDAQTRTIAEVACKALDDVYTTETTTEDGCKYDQQLAVGETYYVDGVAKTVAAGETVYSCYTSSQRAILNKIVTDAN